MVGVFCACARTTFEYILGTALRGRSLHYKEGAVLRLLAIRVFWKTLEKVAVEIDS
jgi:hypothetical protein